MKIIALGMLGLINVCCGIPVSTFLQSMLVALRIDKLAEAIRRQTELDRLEERRRSVEQASPEEAKEIILRIATFELAACRASLILRLDDSWWEEDARDLPNLIRQRDEILRLEPAFCRVVYLQMLEEQCAAALARFNDAVDSYKLAHVG